MTVTFWGVRGSIPAPGPSTVRYGGNTTCVGVEAEGELLVLDAGTGLRLLGEALARRTAPPERVTLLFTHLHSDHVQGFPFFAPLYQTPDERPRLRVVRYDGRGTAWSPLGLLDGVHFPVTRDHLPDDGDSICEVAFEEAFVDGPFRVTRRQIAHPGGAYAYRVEHGGQTLVFAPDHELRVPGAFDALATFAEGAGLLVHDAQYRAQELHQRSGWGHSSAADALRLAEAAGVQALALFHHDPARTDGALDALAARCREALPPALHDAAPAYEGLRLALDSTPLHLGAPATLAAAPA